MKKIKNVIAAVIIVQVCAGSIAKASAALNSKIAAEIVQKSEDECGKCEDDNSCPEEPSE